MTITYRTTNPDAWGSGKGSNLTSSQVDENFWELYRAIQGITITNGVGVASASVSGNQLTFTLTDTTTLGPFTLPTISLNPRGAWQAGTAYALNDLVTYNGSVYLVIRAHSSAVQFDSGANDGAGHNYYGVLISVPGNALPVGGINGQVLSKDSNRDFSIEWTTPHYIPNGGSERQVLSKASDRSYDAAWADIPTIPAAGLAGQFLSKTSNTDYDVSWTSNGAVPAGGIAGQILKKSSDADFALMWVTPSTNLVEATTAATQYLTIDPNEADVFVITMSVDTLIGWANFIHKPIWVVLIGTTASHTATFGSSSFKSTGPLTAAVNGSAYVVQFIPLGNKYIEISRTNAIA